MAAETHQRLLESNNVRIDDTGLRVLDPKAPIGVLKRHVWCFVGGGVVSFRYAPSWSADHPAKMLGNFHGMLQGDGYAGYAAMERENQEKAMEPVAPAKQFTEYVGPVVASRKGCDCRRNAVPSLVTSAWRSSFARSSPRSLASSAFLLLSIEPGARVGEVAINRTG